MAERGRKPGFVMSEEHRVKIRNSNILNALIEHVEGARDMSASQVTAGVALLRKVLPDLTAIEHSGEIATKHEISEKPVTESEWAEQHAQTAH